MKKTILVFMMATLFLSIHPFPLKAQKPPEKGGVLPLINLPVPKNPDERDYLGVSGSGFFKIPQIKAKVVIVEIFSFYCPYCQGDAPRINELYRLIENRSDFKNKIKIIGLGAGNTPFEVETFKKTYQVPFPLFADQDFSIHKAYGGVRTPYFVVVKIDDDGTPQIVHTQAGNFPGAEPYLDLVVTVSGLK